MEFLKVVRVFSLEELRSIPPDAARGLEAILWPSKKRYIFNASSNQDDDNDQVIKPAAGIDGCCQGGRWELENKPPSAIVPPKVFFVNKTDGDVGLGGMSAIPGMEIDLVLAKDTDVTINFSMGFSITAFSVIDVRLTVDGVDYDWLIWNQINGSGGDNSHQCHGSHTITLPLAAGSRSIVFSASATNAGIYANASSPASLTAVVWTP